MVYFITINPTPHISMGYQKFTSLTFLLRPITDFINTPTSALSKYLRGILKPLQYNLTNVVKDPHKFKSKISELSINKN